MILSKLTTSEIKALKAVALDDIITAFIKVNTALFIDGMNILISNNLFTYDDVKNIYIAFEKQLKEKR